MALPTAADVKAYLRLTDAAATADASFITRVLAEVTALVERRLGVPIVAVARTMTVDAWERYTDYPEWRAYHGPPSLFLPLYPVAASPAAVVVNADGATVDVGNYTVDRTTGVLSATTDYGYFPADTYTITATVGMSAAPDYATAIEPVLSGVILDVVADRYQNREPGYSTVTAGGGVSRTHYASGLPPRAEEALALFRRVRV